MNLLMLSGNSLRNKDFIHQAKNEFGSLFDKIYVQGYKHWQTGEENIDLKYELSVIRMSVKYLTPYGIFAKSIGTVLAIQAIEKGLIKPSFLVFCGIPLGFIAQEYKQFKEVVLSLEVPIVIVQNDKDPVGSSEEVRNYLGETVTKTNYIETVGDKHDYEDYDLFRSEFKKLTGR